MAVSPTNAGQTKSNRGSGRPPYSKNQLDQSGTGSWPWIEWLCHTNFSFLVGASHPHEYIERAAQLGYGGLGITDYDGVYGIARSYRNLKSLKPSLPTNQEPLKLFYGAEIHLALDHEQPLVLQDTLVLIAKNARGYENLCRILTHAHRGGKLNANVPLTDLLNFPLEHLAAIQPMRGLIRHNHRQKDVAQRASILQEAFSKAFYLAVSRHFNPSEDTWIKSTIDLGLSLNIPFLLSQDPFFHHPNQKDLSDLIQTIRTNLTIETAVHHCFINSERSLHPLSSIKRRFHKLPIYEAALRSSYELASSCSFDLSELRYVYPQEMIPEGHTAISFLESLVWQSANKVYKNAISQKLNALLHHELRLIRQLHFADYFLTVWDIVHWARSQNILCQGRGSAANSAVCFVLGITSMDPERFDTLFERFISVERGDPPDIDVDFEHERREEVIQYIYQRYGRQRAAMVANVVTFRRRGAIRAVGKAFGLPESLLSQASHLLTTRYFRSTPASSTLEQLQEENSEGQNNSLETNHREMNQAENELNKISAEIPSKTLDDPAPLSSIDENQFPLTPLNESQFPPIPWKIWGEMSERLRGFPRHLGIHSGGFMLSDQPLISITPQEPATMEGRTVIQWCKEDIEALGFFKIDILSLGMLTAVRKCFDLVATHYNRSLTLSSVPQDDAPTYAMIQRADTVGTFQIESRAQMSMLPRLRPKNFYDLVIEIAIIRPGPIQGGMIHPYLRRRNGQDPVIFPDERLRPILERTLGIPIFQEQVMRIAIAVGDFSPGEANELRRHMGAWSIKGDISPWLKRLAIGMRKNGIKEEFIQRILNQMRGFADYGFPESHSVSFAVIAYVSCYLKHHYPAAFFTSLLNSQPMGFYSPHALLQAAMRASVAILPICVLSSNWENTLENIASTHSPKYAIRLGLSMVRSLSETGARNLLAARAKLTWTSLEHFLTTSGLFRSDLTTLAAANALQAFALDRRSALWLSEAAPYCPVLEDIESIFKFSAESSMEKILHSFATTGTSLGPHPTTIIKHEHWVFTIPHTKLTEAKDLNQLVSGTEVSVFGMVLVRQAPPSAKGMVFFTLEDESGFINLAFTPQTYERFYNVIDRQAFLCLSGKLQRQNEGHSIMVKTVYQPYRREAEVIPIHSRLPPKHQVNVLTHQDLQRARNYM